MWSFSSLKLIVGATIGRPLSQGVLFLSDVSDMDNARHSRAVNDRPYG